MSNRPASHDVDMSERTRPVGANSQARSVQSARSGLENAVPAVRALIQHSESPFTVSQSTWAKASSASPAMRLLRMSDVPSSSLISMVPSPPRSRSRTRFWSHSVTSGYASFPSLGPKRRAERRKECGDRPDDLNLDQPRQHPRASSALHCRDLDVHAIAGKERRDRRRLILRCSLLDRDPGDERFGGHLRNVTAELGEDLRLACRVSARATSW